MEEKVGNRNIYIYRDIAPIMENQREKNMENRYICVCVYILVNSGKSYGQEHGT